MTMTLFQITEDAWIDLARVESLVSVPGGNVIIILQSGQTVTLPNVTLDAVLTRIDSVLNPNPEEARDGSV